MCVWFTPGCIRQLLELSEAYKNYQSHIGNFSNVNNCKKCKEMHKKLKNGQKTCKKYLKEKNWKTCQKLEIKCWNYDRVH